MSFGEKLWMGCMNPLPEGRSECGICGYPASGNNEALYLPVHTILSERYLIGKMMESDGDAAVYLGFDKVLKAPILVREFLPDALCERGENNRIRVMNGCENTYREYFEKFRNHARSLARMRELSSIVAIYDIFEQNNTAYTVSEYYEGNLLETRLKQVGGRMRWEEARPLFMPLMASLSSLHSSGIYHLGISTDNLIVGTDGKLRLKGFCIPEARQVNSDLRPKRIAGYSAPEQYAFGQDIGAWSDVYGLAATILRTITGNPPPEGSKRAKDSNDLYVPADVANELPDYVASALFSALQVNPENRTRTIQRFRDQISAAPAVSALIEDEQSKENEGEPTEEEAEQTKKKDKRTKYAILIVAGVFVLLLLLAGTALVILYPELLGGGSDTSNVSTSASTSVVIKSTTKPTAYTEDYSVPNLVGQNYYDIMDEDLTGGFTITVDHMVYSEKAKGVILSQTPNAQEMAKGGTAITVVISAGSGKVTVPNVAGWNYQHAKLYLEALGLKVTEVPVASTTLDKDIVESVDLAGSTVAEGTTVMLRYSITEQTTATTTTTTAKATTTTRK